MSGSTYYDIQVRYDPAEVARAWDLVSKAESDLEALRSQVADSARAHPSDRWPSVITPERPTGNLSPSTIRAHRDRILHIADGVQQEIAAARARVVFRESLKTMIGDDSSELETLAAAWVQSDPATLRDASESDRETPLHRAERLLSALRHDVLAGTRQAIERLVALGFQENEPGAIAMHLDRVSFEVQQANQTASQRAIEAETLQILIDRLHGATEPEALELAGRLAASRSAGLSVDASLLRQAEELAHSVELRQRSERAAAVLKESLASCGYRTGEDFVSLFVEDGDVFVQKPGMGRYYLHVRKPTDGRGLRLNLARREEPGASALQLPTPSDMDMERRWCEDRSAVLENLSRNGVDLNVVHEEPPGAFPLEALPGAAEPAEESTGEAAPGTRSIGDD